MTTATFLASDSSAFLLSPWKPLLILAVFIAWGWLVSAKLEKDARYYHMNFQMWNGIYLGCAVAGLVVMLFLFSFWISFPVGVVVLMAPTLVYWQVRNASVPEEQKYHMKFGSMGDRLEKRKLSRATDRAVLSFKDAHGESRQAPLKEDALFPVHLQVEDVLGPAIDSRASRVELAVSSTGCTIHRVIDGIRYKQQPVPTDLAIKVFQYLKELAGLDIEDVRRRQSGQFELSGPNGNVEVSLTAAGSSKGHVMRLDFDVAARLLRSFDTLGFLPDQLELLGQFEESQDRHGVILLGAPAGQGLSTTGYSAIARHDAYTTNIKTVEREILALLDGMDQAQWDPTNPEVDFATQLQSVLRRDPDIVLAADIQQTETARVVCEPGIKGPLIYVTMNASSVGTHVRDWVKLVGDVEMAVKPLRAVVNERLVRLLCPNCKQPYQPRQGGRLRLPEGVTELFRPGGKVQVKNKIEMCPICNGSGYLGQTGVFEVMIIDRAARDLLKGGDLKGALAHCRREKMVLLQEAALHKVISGETSMEEVARITGGAAGGKSEAAAPAEAQETPAGA